VNGACREKSIFGFSGSQSNSLLATSGKIAGAVAGRKGGEGAWLSGPSSPFELSVAFLAAGMKFTLMCIYMWIYLLCMYVYIVNSCGLLAKVFVHRLT
jgi:hypothetical protein